MTRGTATGHVVANHDVDAVITGHIGRKAEGILKEAGIKLYLGAQEGTVREVVEAYNEGNLLEASATE